MPTDTELVNAALRKVGARRIGDINESVASAGIAQDILTTERDDLLRSLPWNFATTRAVLAQLADVPLFEFAHAYPLPSDWMRTVAVYDNDAGEGVVRYKMESVKQADESYVSAIVTDAEQLFLRYVRRVTDPNVMAASFRQVLILRMAKIFAVGIAKSNALQATIDEELKSATRAARSSDAIEDYPDSMPEGSWASSRRRWSWGARDPWSR